LEFRNNNNELVPALMGPCWKVCSSSFASEEHCLFADLHYRDCLFWSGEDF